MFSVQHSPHRVMKASLPLSVVAKVSMPVVDAADSMLSRVETAFLNAGTAVRESLSLAELEDLLERNDVNGLTIYLDMENRWASALRGAGITVATTSFLEAIQDTFKAGALAEMKVLESQQVVKAANTIGAAIAFDLISPEVIAFLGSYAFNLIRELSAETALSVGDVIRRAFLDGVHPYEQAREIRGLVGLTRQQAMAVSNFRRMLRGDPTAMREALTRALRDRRFDPTILRAVNTGSKLSRQQITTMTQRYYERYRAYRAKMIARTETLRASHMGQKELWRQAADQGLLPAARTRRMWLLAPGACPVCIAIPKLNPDGVGLEDTFRTEEGSIDIPPAHPHCRCTTGLKFLRPPR